MDNKKHPVILLLEDEVEEYNNWKKWINLTNNKAVLIYCADVESAVDEIKKTDVDIYLIDVFLAYGNGIDFLEIIKNKRGLKIAVTTTKDITDVVRIYALGAIVINKQNNTKDCLRIVELVFSIWSLGVIAEADYPDNSLVGAASEINKLTTSFSSIMLKFQIIEEEVEKMKIYLLGNYELKGFKDRLEDIEATFNDIKTKSNLKVIIDYIEGGSPTTRIIVSILLILLFVTLPILALYKMFKG